jgi:hypothetical protein
MFGGSPPQRSKIGRALARADSAQQRFNQAVVSSHALHPDLRDDVKIMMSPFARDRRRVLRIGSGLAQLSGRAGEHDAADVALAARVLDKRRAGLGVFPGDWSLCLEVPASAPRGCALTHDPVGDGARID